MKSNVRKLLMIITILCMIMVLLSSCVSISTLQTPETLEPGDIQVGAGTLVIYDEANGLFPLFEIGGRFGLAKNVDIGFKYAYLNVWVFDAKYQFIEGKINASIDMGASVCKSGNDYYYALYPMVLVGQKHWYAGIKGTATIRQHEFGGIAPTIITGARIGKDKFNMLIELNTIINLEDGNFGVVVLPSIGFNYKFKVKSRNKKNVIESQ